MNILDVQKSTFVMLGGLLFGFLDPSLLWGCNFLIFYSFSTIVRVSDAPRGGVQILFGY